MNRAAKEREVRLLKSEASSPKSQLISLVRRLEAAGAVRDARGLDAVIARLEAWQNR